MYKSVMLNNEQLNRLFPYFLIINSNLEVLDCSVLVKLMSGADLLTNLTSSYTCMYQENSLITYEDILNVLDKPVELVPTMNKNAVLICNLTLLPHTNEILFIGKPSEQIANEKIKALYSSSTDIQVVKPKEGTMNGELLKSKQSDYILSKIQSVAINNIKPALIVDEHGMIEWVNTSFEREFGWKINELVGKRPEQFLRGKDSLFYPDDYLNKKMMDKKSFEFENVGYVKDNSKIWFKATVTPILDEHGKVLGRFSVFYSVSKYEISDTIAELNITNSHHFNIEKVDWEFDVKKQRLHISDGFQKLIGLKNVEHTKELSYDEGTTFKTSMLNGLVSKITKTNPEFLYVHDFKVANSTKQLVIHGRVDEWEEGNLPSKIKGNIVDFSNILLKDKELKYFNELLTEVINQSNIGLMFENLEGTIVFVNMYFCKLISENIVPENLLGSNTNQSIQNYKWLFKKPDEFVDRVNELKLNSLSVNDEIVIMADNRVLERTFLPIIIDNECTGYLWRYKEISEKYNWELKLMTLTERLSAMVKNLHEGVLVEDEHRKIVLTNQKFCNIFNIPVTPENLVGADCTNSAEQTKFLFANPNYFVHSIEIALENKVKVQDEIFEMVDGRTLSRDYSPIYIGGIYYGHLWKYRDVTEQVIYEKKLKEQKEYYHRILNEIPISISVLAPDRTIQFVNEKAVNNKETRNWLIGKNPDDYFRLINIDNQNKQVQKELFDEVILSQGTKQILSENKLNEQETEYILRKLHPVFDENNIIKYVISYGIDISEQKRSELFTQAQEERIRNLLEIINDGVFRCFADGTINLYNDSFLKIMNINCSGEIKSAEYFNLSKEQNINKLRDAKFEDLSSKKVLNLFDLLGYEAIKQIKQKINLLYDTMEPQFGIFTISNNGETKYIDYTLTLAIRSIDAAFVGRISDITAQVEKENNFINVIEKEKELNFSKSRFVNITSHELRTPLAIILANTEILELLQEQDADELTEIKPQVITERIKNEVHKITNILSQLLMIGRIEAGSIELETEDIDVKEFVSNLINEYFNPAIDGRMLNVIYNSPVSVFCFDKKLINLALLNLIGNAFKYSAGKASPIFYVTQYSESLVFKIQDFGIGIPPQEQNKLFTSFFRASNVSNISGTGLGLIVIDFAVRKHNGKILIESKLNEGTIFEITIPKQQ